MHSCNQSKLKQNKPYHYRVSNDASINFKSQPVTTLKTDF